MNIPNLDKMNARDLLSFWVQYRTPTKEQADALLKDNRGNTSLASLLASYAWTKAQVLELKAKTKRKPIEESRLTLYTSGCEAYYNQIPRDLQWRNPQPLAPKPEPIKTANRIKLDGSHKAHGHRPSGNNPCEEKTLEPSRFFIAPPVEPKTKTEPKSQRQPRTVEGGKTQQARRKRDLIRRAQEKKLAFKSCEPVPHSPACPCSTQSIQSVHSSSDAAQ